MKARNETQFFQKDETEDEMDLRAWKSFEVAFERPSLFFTLAFVFGVTSLLFFFQATTYLGEAISPFLAWGIAMTCELSLCYVTILFSLKRNRFFTGLLFIAFFSYVLGTMAYGIKKNEGVEMHKITESDSNSNLLRESIRKAQAALDLAISRKESGNVARGTKTLADLSTQLEKSMGSQNPAAELVETRSLGLIFLRALLMLINAIAIHHIIVFIRNVVLV
jgi:hypothetical protein